ncbi:hypothetical protein ACIQ62_24970 [Streptomyces sp. NPDC096319]|uniref:hypothetical protein n=1 Tax=Streptomyces sp. NPDC096319 TaxID=3366084 RepID=UPI0038269058
MGVAKRKTRWWVWLVVALVALCGLPVTLLMWGAYSFSQAGKPQPVDCAAAMQFAHGRLPADAEEARCTEAHWQDSFVTVDFRLPRAGVADWLETTYPGAKAPAACDGDLCRDTDFGQALYVSVEVAYEGDAALVHLTAFNV